MDPQSLSDGSAVVLGLAGKAGAASAAWLLSKLLAPFVENVGEGLVPPAVIAWKEQRLANGREILAEATRIAEAKKRGLQPVPGRILFPILEKASIEPDPGLRTKWIHLLATATTSPDEVLPSFTSILGELSPIEGQILDYVYPIVLRVNRIDEQLAKADSDGRRRLYEERSPVDLQLESGRVMAACSITVARTFEVLAINLERVALVRTGNESGFEGGVATVHLTALGEAFMHACTGH